ncbi:hypothetical protein VZT92_017931 [Zoarces viviparus]|uniref:Uncharacterized protein n=1 Tax=Zoarces viviparus TaxID=48416 RepID=A0AAW1ES21_ZOAVI
MSLRCQQRSSHIPSSRCSLSLPGPSLFTGAKLASNSGVLTPHLTNRPAHRPSDAGAGLHQRPPPHQQVGGGDINNKRSLAGCISFTPMLLPEAEQLGFNTVHAALSGEAA